jgi:toxin HigB-1
MIASFGHKGLRDFWITNSPKGIPANFALRLELILDALETAQDIAELNVPGFNCTNSKMIAKENGQFELVATGVSRSNSAAATPATSTLRTTTRSKVYDD